MKFIVALTEHRFLGHIFVPYFVEQLKVYYSVLSVAREGTAMQSDYALSDDEKRILQLADRYNDAKLASKFSRNRNSIDFFNTTPRGYLEKNVFPYIEKQMYEIARILMKGNIPLFQKDANYAHLYDEDIIAVSPDFATHRFSFERNEQGTDYRVKVYQDGNLIQLVNRKVIVITNNPCVMAVANQLLVFNDMDAKKVSVFTRQHAIHVPKNIEPRYYSDFVKRMVSNFDVEASGFEIITRKTWDKVTLRIEIGLKGSPVFIFKFKYGNVEILLEDSRETLADFIIDGDKYMFYKYIRNREGENAIVDFLTGKGAIPAPGGFSLPNINLMEHEEAIRAAVNWLSENKSDFDDRGIAIEQCLNKNYFLGTQKVEFDLKQNNDWFDLYAIVKIGEFSFPFIKLKRYIMNDIREFELPNGEIAILPDEWFEKYKELFQFGKTEGNKLTFRNFHLELLHEKIAKNQLFAADLLEKCMIKIDEVAIPSGLKATLRGYQKKGFDWLYALYKNSMGACLADDMGLGKTLQTIALLLKAKPQQKLSASAMDAFGQLSLFDVQPVEEAEQEHVVSLVVVPTSLIHNWVNEFAKFAPSLRIFVYAGTRRSRFGEPVQLAQSYDVILTTYGTLRNDVDSFSKIDFRIMILDESQYIKNRSSKIYSVVTELNAKCRIALTGTPIENSLSDLWSQMNFLNKGLLGSYTFFKKKYQSAIEDQADEKSGEKLRLLIRPFILRRTKSEVAKDLPSLTEQVLYCTMTDEQDSVYQREKSIIRNAILDNIEAKGVSKSSLIILRGLMRLRQLANHPALVKDVENHGSAKFDEIIDALSNLTAEKHKVLIFSSFVTHLEILKTEIERQGWRYSMLTGQTSNREKVIKKFQEDTSVPIFLISLKAGGVGLNLTGADYIFIVDPWWNPAAEQQAISRAHRIGQDKNVFVYRFVTEGTIEEKIQTLQQRKSVLADKFINSNNPFQVITLNEIASLFE